MPENDVRKPLLDLSVTQLVGSSLAAATAAALGSRVGVVGTILGAALASVVSAVAAAAYTQSLRTARDRLADRDFRLPRPSREAREDREPTGERWWRRIPWPRVALAAVAVFAVTAAAITGLELISGRSLDGSGSSTVGQVVAPDPSASPTSTTTDDAEPSDSASGTATPSADPTVAPTEAPDPSDDATATPEPSASATASPTAGSAEQRQDVAGESAE